MQRKKATRGKFNQALARSPVFGFAKWDTAEWTADTMLAEMLLAAIHAPNNAARGPVLEALARQPLLVSLPTADPEIRALLTELGRTPAGLIVRRDGFPRFCSYAVRLAWADVESLRDAPPAVLAAQFHARAMRYMGDLLRGLKAEPNPSDALAHLGPLSAEDAARLDEVIAAHPPAPRRYGELELETIACVLQYVPPRDRDLALIESLGDEWRGRQATMLGCKPGALRMRRWRRNRDAARIDPRSVRSQT